MKPKSIHIAVSDLVQHTLKIETDTAIVFLVNQQVAEQLKKEPVIQVESAIVAPYHGIPFTYL